MNKPVRDAPLPLAREAYCFPPAPSDRLFINRRAKKGGKAFALAPSTIPHQKETSYRRPLYWSREPKELEAGARMPMDGTVDSTAKRQLIRTGRGALSGRSA